MDGDRGNVPGVPNEVADAGLGPQHDWLAQAELRDSGRDVVLHERHQRADDGHEHGPAVGVRMLSVARSDRPHDDAARDVPLDRDRDLDLSLEPLGRKTEIARKAARVEAAGVEHPCECVGREAGAILRVTLRETAREQTEDAAVVGRGLDRPLFDV